MASYRVISDCLGPWSERPYATKTSGGHSVILARAVQQELTAYYHLEPSPDIEPFLIQSAPDERETVFVREDENGDLELAVRVPDAAFQNAEKPQSRDSLCQVIEGVSHFLLLVERSRIGLSTTHLELELQAEVDKFVLLTSRLGHGHNAQEHWRETHRLLFENVQFCHSEHSEEGERYRVVNRLAAKFCHRVGSSLVDEKRSSEHRAKMRRFYRGGQNDKLWMVA